LTDLLEEAVRCQFFQQRVNSPAALCAATQNVQNTQTGESYALFSKEHMRALVDSANQDSQFRAQGAETGLTTSLTLFLEDTKDAWTVQFVDGQITAIDETDGGEFMIGGRAEWWNAVFSNRIDAFLATQQGKLKLQHGELAALSRWYKPFQRAFAIWQAIPVH
jgi:putative sterol carrier protein